MIYKLGTTSYFLLTVGQRKMESAKFQRDTKGMVNMSMVLCDTVYISPHVAFCKLIHTSTQNVLPHIYFSIKFIYLVILSLFSFFPESMKLLDVTKVSH